MRCTRTSTDWLHRVTSEGRGGALDEVGRVALLEGEKPVERARFRASIAPAQKGLERRWWGDAMTASIVRP
jgi:hypothetical protein